MGSRQVKRLPSEEIKVEKASFVVSLRRIKTEYCLHSEIASHFTCSLKWFLGQRSQVLGSNCKEKRVCGYKQQLNVPNSPKHAMEFLCRSWSPAASNLLLHSDPNELEDENMKNTTGPHTSTIMKGNIRMEFTHAKTWLGGKSWTSLLRSRKEKKKEEMRLQTAQLHAALSLTQLAAAIAGISNSKCKQENPPFQNSKSGVWSQDMSNSLASAAALLTTVCAETAELLGAQREQVRATVNSGLAIQTPTDMIAVTATAATCLRGAALLKSRAMADPISRIQEMLKIGAQTCLVMPSGRKECTRVSVYLKHDHLIFSFRKKYFGGALTSSKEYKVNNIREEREECQGYSYLFLNTKSGIIKLLFEDEMQSRIWISTIFNLLELRNPC